MSRHEQLLEAHVAFELARFRDEHIRASLEEELGALYDWLRGVRLKDLISRRAALEVIHARLLDPEPTAEGRAFAASLLDKTRVLLLSTHDSLGDLLPPEVPERLTEDLVAAENLRRELVRGLVGSPIYTRIISEVLFDGIKSFVQAGNVAKNLPGAQALLTLGQNLIGGVAPGIEEKFEASIKDFIASHSREILKDSEEIILRSMKPELMGEAVQDAYRGITGRSLSSVVQLLPHPEREGGVATLEAVWKRLRRPLVENLATLWVDLALNHYGYRQLGELFDQADLDRDAFLREGDVLLGAALVRAREDGYLEARIRARLSAFYESETARELIG